MQAIATVTGAGTGAGVKDWAGRLLATESDAATTAARVALGAVMLPHGAQKLLGWFGGYGFGPTLDYLTKVEGLPWIVGLAVILIESFGALALLAGLGGRLAAAGVAAVMIGAVAKVHWPLGFFMNWGGTLKGEGFEYHLLAVGLALVIILRGSGAWSADRAIARRLGRQETKE